MRIASILLLLLAGFALARADIAPTTFAGGSIVPVDIDDMHFKNALVRITWGAPCTLEATFEIVSDRKEPASLEIGFPVGRYDPAYHNYEAGPGKAQEADCREAVPASILAIAVNGEDLRAFRRISIPIQCSIRSSQASWYFANVTLKPGSNSIRLTTHLTPSGVYAQPYQRKIDYCVWTGGRWSGKIAHERIEVIFPDGISSSLIQEAKPDLYEVEDNRLVWDYQNIEPRNDFFDISVIVQVPEVDAIISRMRREHRANPTDVATALKLARHLFLLGNAKGNSGFPPPELPAVDYFNLIAPLAEQEKVIMAQHYSLLRGDRMQAPSSEWTDERLTVLRILADQGWCENYPGVGNVLEAKAIIEEVLKREPSCEKAWTLLLANYWRFSFAARGHWFGETVLGAKQAADIRKAHQSCPNSQPILSWYELLEAKDGPAGRGPTGPHAASAEVSEFEGILKKYENTDADGWK